MHSCDSAAEETMPKVNRGKGNMSKQEDHESDYSELDSGSQSDSSMDLSETSEDEDFIVVSNLFYLFIYFFFRKTLIKYI